MIACADKECGYKRSATTTRPMPHGGVGRDAGRRRAAARPPPA